jgi:hypothetical protein
MSRDYGYQAIQARRCATLWRSVVASIIVDSGLAAEGMVYGRGKGTKIKIKGRSFNNPVEARLERDAALNFLLGKASNTKLICDLAGLCSRKLRTWATKRIDAIERLDMELAA